MRRAHAVRVGLLGAAIAVAAGCRSPTQITVEVTTDVKCADIRATTFTVGDLTGLDTRPLTSSTDRCDPALSRIGSLVIVPSGANDDTVAIRVVVGLGKDPSLCVPPNYGPGCIVARRALRFIPHESLTLPIFMAASCNGIGCGETETCVQGDCRPATIPDPDLCTNPTGCAETTLPPATGNDAGGRDASEASAALCPPVDAMPCTSALAAGWSPLAFANATAASCPDGYTTTDLVTTPGAPANACKCACKISPADPPSCAKGVLTGTVGSTMCDGQAVGGPINGSVCVVNPGVTGTYAKYAPLGLTPGTCIASPIVDQGASFARVRACVPSPACGEAVCNGVAPAGFASCIVHDGDVPCPGPPFANPTLAGAQADIACAGCATCNNTATCSVPTVRAYNDSICTTEVTSVVVNGACNLLTGTPGVSFGSIKYDVTLTNASCTPTSPPTATASLAAPRTICCR
jgi:hypothetical protein